MVCEICGVDAALAILPIRQPNGSLITLGCIDCARTQGVWCDRHERPHIDLGDGHGCLLCIETDTRSGGVTNYIELFETSLPQDEYETLVERALVASTLSETDLETSVRRFIITCAHSLNITTEEVLLRIIRERSTAFLFPNPLL